MKAVIILALAACAFALNFKNDPFWVAYKQQFNKVYAANEEAMRYRIFKKNMAKAAELNEIDTATYGWTKFSDQERNRPLLEVPAHIRRTRVAVSNDLPDNFDWRDKGAVAEVKDQGQCGSCWAFCSVVAMEGAYFLEHSELISLSEEQIVDCDSNDHGCSGGWPTNAFAYVQECGGLMSEEDYPYTAPPAGECQFDASKAKMQVKDIETFPGQSESQMMSAVQQYGPLAIALDASKFDFYSGGIMNGDGCYAGSPDHGVAVVGWGVEDGTSYWIVKNSWGADWGEDGYVRIERGNNACGVEDFPMGVVAV